MRRLWLLLIFASALQAAETPALDAAQQARFDALIEELRCLVCQNQNLKESHAPLAQDLRHEVVKQIAAGKDDDAIKDYLVARYGDFVLYRPRFQPSTWVLWLAPGVLLLGALVVVLRLLRRQPEPPAPPPDAAAVDRILHSRDNLK